MPYLTQRLFLITKGTYKTILKRLRSKFCVRIDVSSGNAFSLHKKESHFNLTMQFKPIFQKKKIVHLKEGYFHYMSLGVFL